MAARRETEKAARQAERKAREAEREVRRHLQYLFNTSSLARNEGSVVWLERGSVVWLA